MLVTEKTVSLRVSFAENVPEALRAPWVEALEAALAGAGLAVTDPEHLRAVLAEVDVHLDVGPGRTDAGVAFFAAKARAVITIQRARVRREGAPAVRATEEEAIRDALTSLCERVADSIGW